MHLPKLFALSLLVFFTACDDGDVVLTELDFDTADLEFCISEDDEETVFYNYNSSTNEVLFLIVPEEFDIDGDDDRNDGDDNEIEGAVSDNGYLLRYIKFGSSIVPNDFFCTAVASVESIERDLDGTRGTINITSINKVNLDEDEDAASSADEDGDGIPNFRELFADGITRADYQELIDPEGFINFEALSVLDIPEGDVIRDTDRDGIPDFRDADDDNDNVSTSRELFKIDENDEDGDGDMTDNLIVEDTDGNLIYLDTDQNGVPDYLDADDDGDGTFTRLELDMENDNGVAAYLDADEDTVATLEEDIETTSSYNTTVEVIAKVSNATLAGSDGSEITFVDDLFIGQTNEPITIQLKVTFKTDGTFESVRIDDNVEIDISDGPIDLVPGTTPEEIIIETETP